MNVIVNQLVEFLLGYCFKSRRSMAVALGIGYRTFLNVCAGKASVKVQEKVLQKIVRYCIQQNISLEHAIKI